MRREGDRSSEDAERALCYRVERFLYHEAALLDDRRHHDWLHLLAEDFRYEMPVRTTAPPDPSLEGKDAMWAVERELSGPGELGFWNENKLAIAVRVARSRQVQAWAESPPARTRRIVGNVTLLEDAPGGELAVRSNLLLSHGRLDEPPRLFTAERRDRLRPDAARGFLLVHRRVIPDWTVFPAGSMTMYF
jgi:3-phenylpropionate/cinnamic acid dioxygenase small subunit